MQDREREQSAQQRTDEIVDLLSAGLVRVASAHGMTPPDDPGEDQKRRRQIEHRMRTLTDELCSINELPTRSKSQSAKASEHRREIERLRVEAVDLDDRIARTDQRLIDEDELLGAVESFDPVWKALTIVERERLIHALVKQVQCDAASDSVTVVFYSGDERADEHPYKEAPCTAVV